MAIHIGDEAPNFTADTTQGTLDFHEWLGDSWGVLFSHPKDFTPVCTTELGYLASIAPEFEQRNVKVIGLSVDADRAPRPVGRRHRGDPGRPARVPDHRRHRLQRVEALRHAPRLDVGRPAVRTPADNATVRNVFVVGPDKKVKLILVYPMSTGRNFDEVLRVIDSLQLTAKHSVATPAKWKQGEDVIIGGAVSDEKAKELFPDGWKSPKPYIRIVPQPQD